MPRSYDMAAEYPCSVAEVYGAFAEKAYWLERLEKSGCDAVSLDKLTVWISAPPRRSASTGCPVSSARCTPVT
jgi:hypothetical protein